MTSDAPTKKKPSSEAIKPQKPVSSCGFFVSGSEVLFRPMGAADLDEVMAIERDAYRYPWSSGFFLQELQVACARSILAELGGQIIGYVLFWSLPGALDIHNIAVHRDYRRQGLARQLMELVAAQAKRQLLGRVTLEVRISNLPAQKLYESLGFIQNGFRRGYYSDNNEDAIMMALELSSDG